MKRLIIALSLLLVLGACDERIVDINAPADEPGVGFELSRSANSTLPKTVDRVRLRVWNDTVERTTDVALPAEGATRSVGVNVPSGLYDVALVVYSDAWNEAYAFADQSGVKVGTDAFTEVPLDLESVLMGPDYLLDQEIQITPETGELTLGSFFSTPELHPSLPEATLHYDTAPFAPLDSARFETAMAPELNAFYTARLAEMDDLSSSDSVYFRVTTPLHEAWGDSLRAIAPSVANGEEPYSASLGGGIVVMFLEQSPPW